jgi:hypothetical protein
MPSGGRLAGISGPGFQNSEARRDTVAKARARQIFFIGIEVFR